MRTPSWTDRILYKSNNCELIYYNRQEIIFSDHRPVLCILQFQVSEIDSVKYNQIMQLQVLDLQSNYNRKPQPKTPIERRIEEEQKDEKTDAVIDQPVVKVEPTIDEIINEPLLEAN